jgi:hypothetical protein
MKRYDLIKSFDHFLIGSNEVDIMSKSDRSKSRLAYLLNRLSRIQKAIAPEDVEEPMHNFTSELLQLRNPRQREAVVFKKGDESLLFELARYGAIPIILDAIIRFNDDSIPEFHNSACIALVHFAFQSRERSLWIYERGGFYCINKMMETYRSVDYIQIISIAALMVVGKNVGIDLFELESVILSQIIIAMDFHQESAQLYIVACSALGTLFSQQSRFMTPESEEEIELFHRVIDSICYGLAILHLDDSVAQSLGKSLLCNMVGRSVAEEMILFAENSHGAFAAAAA